MKKHLVLFIFLYLPCFLFAQHADTSYQIFDSKSGKVISLDLLITKLKKSDVVVYGEEHNDSIGHLLQAQLYTNMINSFSSTALSLEMFATDVQPVIDEYLAGLISEKNFVKESRAWPNNSDYQPLIEIARQHKADVICANVAPRYSNAVSLSGLGILDKFPATSKVYLPPLPIDTAVGRYYEKFTEILGGHGMGTMKIYQTQNLWDAAMAWSIARYAKQNPMRKILQINGRFHSDEKIGLIAQLKKYAPKLNVSNISCFAAESTGAVDWTKYANLADYIIVTSGSKKGNGF